MIYERRSYDHYNKSEFYPHKLAVCRQQVSQWRTRLLCEFATSKVAYNVCLTVDPQHYKVAFDSSGRPDSSHLVKFWKNLRRWLDYHYDKELKLPRVPKLKYFQVTEFGDKNGRLHYHVLVFFDMYLDYWTMSAIFEKKWKLGFVHFRSMSARHCFYNTKYIQKKFFLPYFKSQSQGIGLDFAVKVAEYAVLHDNRFTVEGHRRTLTRYQANKVLTPDQLLELRQRYVAKCEAVHNKLISFHNTSSVPLEYEVYMSAYAFGRANRFLQTYYCTDSWKVKPELSNFFDSFDGARIVSFGDGDPADAYDRMYRVKWKGIFARYFIEHSNYDRKFDEMKNNPLISRL